MVKLKRRLCELTMKKPCRLNEVKAIVEAVGEHNFPQLMEPEPALSGKNVLHMAAWTGDLETIQYLMEMGRRYNTNAATTTTNMDIDVDVDVDVHDHLDLVNVVSTGVGNYSKSPICYAITQDRDDVIQYLLSEEHNATELHLS
jgi:ankyrin repeat protein